MAKRFVQLLCLILMAPLLGGGGCHKNHYGLVYEGRFALDAENNLHIFYSNTYAKKAWHLEKKPGGEWQRNLVGSTKVGPLSGPGILYFEEGKKVLDYNFTPDGKFQNFFLINQETGEKTEHLPPLDMEIFSPYTAAGLKAHVSNKLPFYNEGQWDERTFIHCMTFNLHNKDNPNLYDTKEAACFALSFVGNHWEIEKVKEFSVSDRMGINYLFFEGFLATVLDRELFVKKNLGTGVFSIEPFPPAYQVIYNHLDRFRPTTVFHLDPPGFYRGDLIDREGKVHILVREGSTFKADLYHEVYNPDAADPTVPELREFIEHQE